MAYWQNLLVTVLEAKSPDQGARTDVVWSLSGLQTARVPSMSHMALLQGVGTQREGKLSGASAYTNPIRSEAHSPDSFNLNYSLEVSLSNTA